MKTMLLIALMSAVAGLIIAMTILYNLLFAKKNRLEICEVF